MDIIAEVLLPLILIGLFFLGLKAVWVSGFVCGTVYETRLWLDAIDDLMVPNWQNLPIASQEGLTPEQVKWMNKVYVSAYALALHTIKVEIADARRETMEKADAEEERKRLRFERGL